MRNIRLTQDYKRFILTQTLLNEGAAELTAIYRTHIPGLGDAIYQDAFTAVEHDLMTSLGEKFFRTVESVRGQLVAYEMTADNNGELVFSGNPVVPNTQWYVNSCVVGAQASDTLRLPLNRVKYDTMVSTRTTAWAYQPFNPLFRKASANAGFGVDLDLCWDQFKLSEERLVPHTASWNRMDVKVVLGEHASAQKLLDFRLALTKFSVKMDARARQLVPWLNDAYTTKQLVMDWPEVESLIPDDWPEIQKRTARRRLQPAAEIEFVEDTDE